MPDLARNKKISLLSLTQREKRNAELDEARKKTEWLHRTEKILKDEIEKIKYIYAKLEEIEKIKKRTEEVFNFVFDKLQNFTCRTLQKEDAGEYYLLGWQPGKYNSMVLMLDITDTNKYKYIYANTRMDEFLRLFTPFFNQREINKWRTINFYRPITNNYTDYFIFKIEEQENFLSGGKWVKYFPVYVNTKMKKLKVEIEKILEEEKYLMEKAEGLFLEKIEAPEKTKDADKCTEVEEGDYKIKAFSQVTYRGKNKTFLYLERLNQPELKFLVWGHWIEEEIKKIEKNKKLNQILKPVFCRLGIVKTTPNKRKARTCTICYN